MTVAVLAPFGLVMGMAMPIGLRRYEALHPGGVPFAWAANGFASVVAAALATVLALVFGFTVTTIVGGALLRRRARGRSIRQVGARGAVVAWTPEGWQSGRMQWS